MSDSRDRSDICVIIPAYNEEATVGDVIRNVRHYLPKAEVIVINDGSHDRTADICRQVGATVISLPFNLGIGGAVQTGLKYALRKGYDMAIEIDADGQHDPKYAPALIEVLRLNAKKTGVMVIGSRFVSDVSYRASYLRSVGIHLFSWLIRAVTGQRIYDSTSGYRVYDRQAMKYLSIRYPTDFPEPESIVMLLSNGFKIIEAPVIMGERVGGTSVIAHDASLKAAYFVASNAIAILLTGIKERLPHARS